ncbi:MAG: TetR/AcrR family transcriptional regulator [Gammaproteobacteria bacterium]|uniref:TetR/AcrR family transcriptional regulator n=1 Tax=Nevskia sp. TaxID=1929292 RepID=UPI004035F480|nr:TetR/AcrR family transcriptional regulator [Gammaproteobacteria bacterium]
MAKVKPAPPPAEAAGPVPAADPAKAVGVRGERRREALLAAGRAVFLESGYEGASIEEVMRRVGGSKASLYRYFGSKEGLFGAIIESGCREFMGRFRVPTGADDDIAATLTEIARRFASLFLDAERRELFRIMIAEMPRFPALAQRFYENGPARARKLLGDYFQRQHEAGRLHCPDPEFAAVQFIEMVKAAPQHRAMLGLSPFLPGRDAAQHIAGVVDLFLHGCARAPAATPKDASR